jgi:DNA polymerase-3 subunit gamma/tau
VYIIDEVHMLTKEAFNALLKTLEEPPEHAVFILATTEAHKLPDTIVSRTQRFSFKPVSQTRVAEHLAAIAKQEKIKIAPEALDLLAVHGEGSFRDSISLLDQLGGHKQEIGVEDVRRILGIPPAEAIDDLIGSISGSKGTGPLMYSLDGLFAAGYQPAGIAAQIAARLRTQLVEGNAVLEPGQALALLERLIEVPAAHDPARFLEIILLGAIPVQDGRDVSRLAAPAPDPDPVPEPPAPTDKQEDPAPPRKPSSRPKQAAAAKAPEASGSAPFDESSWPAVLQTLKKNHNTLYGVVRMASPSFPDDGTLKLTFAFAFHEKRLKEASNSRKLADVIRDLTGKSVKVECALDKSVKPPAALDDPKPQAGPELDAISNIFGATELLES